MQLKRGDAAGARKSLDVALLFDSALAEAHFNLGLLHQAAGEGEQAVAAYRHAVAADPELDAAHANLAAALAQRRDFRSAQDAFRARARLFVEKGWWPLRLSVGDTTIFATK